MCRDICQLCGGSGVEPSLDVIGGGYICVECADDPECAGRVVAAAREQLAAREAAQQQPRPVQPEPRRSMRESRRPTSIYEPQWSTYELARSGERHDHTREESYTTVQAKAEAAALDNAELAARLDQVFGRLRELAVPGGPGETCLEDVCEATAAVILREAIADLTHDFDRRQEGAAPQEEAAPREEAGAEPGPSGAEGTTPRWVASPVRMGGVDGTVGELCITAPFLSWKPSNPSGASDEPALQLLSNNVLFAEIDD
jgi:hypothetical protein